MLRLILLGLVVLAAWARGGSLANFALLPLRSLPLVAAGFGIQLVIFTSLRDTLGIGGVAVPALYVLSMALLTLWVALNRRVPGMALMGLGLLCNFAAIVANDGYMPVSPASASFAGTLSRYQEEGGTRSNNSVAADEGVRLWLLTDILPVPKQVPFANVLSIGDVILTVGAGVLCYRTVRGPRGAVTSEQGMQTT
jgi:hypothetical protein